MKPIYNRLLLVCCLVLLPMLRLGAQTKDDAIKLIQNEEFEKARNILSKLITATPKEADLYYHLGNALLFPALKIDDDPQARKNLLEQAKLQYTNGISKSSKYPYNYVGLGMYYAANKNEASAKTELEKASSLEPANIDLSVKVALGYILINSTEAQKKAEVLLVNAEAKDPKNPEIFIALGDLYYAKKVFELALKKYETALTLKPNYVPALFRIGEMKIAEKKYLEGADYYQKAITADPNFPSPYRALGDLYNRAGKYDKAAENLKKYFSMIGNEKDVRAQAIYAQALYLNKQYGDATVELEKALKDTTTAVLLRLKGYCLMATGKTTEAKTAMDAFFSFTNAIQEYRIGKDYLILGDIFAAQNNSAEAIKNYEKAMTMEAELADSVAVRYENIADKLVEAKDYAAALPLYEKALAAKPASKYYYAVGKMQYLLKKYEEADKNFAIVNEKSPSYLMGHIYRARTNYELDPDYEKALAIPHYEKVVEVAKADPVKNKKALDEAYGALGYYQMNVKKDNAKALEIYKAWSAVSPDDAEVKETLDYLEKQGGK